MSGDASVSTQHREACLACLLDGLKSIGIRGDVNAAIDFSAIGNAGNYSLVDSFAHAIEACLDGKGYIVASLVDGFRAAALSYAVALWLFRWASGDELRSEEIVPIVACLDRSQAYAPLTGRRHRRRIATLSQDGQLQRLVVWYAR